MRAAPIVLVVAVTLTVPVRALKPDVLQAVSAVPPDIAGRFREAVGFQQSASGQYFVFDRRAHTVYGIDAALTSSWEIVRIGAEPGRIIEPTAFSVEPQGSFAVADAPGNRERVQIFTPAGFLTAGFFLPGAAKHRVVLDGFVMNGIGTLQYTGAAILMNRPETGSLIGVYDLHGAVTKSFGALRHTGHEDDRELHLALNSGIPLVDPAGGFYFVFQTGEPVFRKYDRSGALVFERRIQGREIDDVVANLPSMWPRRQTETGELPLAKPTVRAAAVDRAGNLWISFVVPYTYVYDSDGDKSRTVQFRAAGLVAPNSLAFGVDGRILVTPGLNLYRP